MKTYTFSRSATFEVTLIADVQADSEAEARARAAALPHNKWRDSEGDLSGNWAHRLGQIELEYVPED